jgi:hypothetical protein
MKLAKFLVQFGHLLRMWRGVVRLLAIDGFFMLSISISLSAKKELGENLGILTLVNSLLYSISYQRGEVELVD